MPEGGSWSLFSAGPGFFPPAFKLRYINDSDFHVNQGGFAANGPVSRKKMKLKTAILGVTGYVGQQLLSLLARHPEVDLRVLTSEKFSGMRTDEAFPHLSDCSDIVLSPVSKVPGSEPLDLLFSCLPGGISSVFVRKFLERGARVIDLSPDLRFSDPADYSRAHGAAPRFPELLPRAVYGLSELNRERIKDASLVANAGCYSTCVSLALVPFLKKYDVGDDIIADIKSSFSTSGRAPKPESHYAEAKEDVSARGAGGDDQKHEILRVLSDFCGVEKKLVFLNTRVPVKRGIMAASYLSLRSGVSRGEIMETYAEFYRDDVFVRVCDSPPGMASVSGSNYVSLGFCEREGHLVVVSVLDNLMKGAAGQAVQNMNVVFGFSEDEGLRQVPLFP